MVLCIPMLNSAMAQQILIMDAVQREPIPDAEVVIFSKGQPAFLISNAIGVVKYPTDKSYDSIIVNHTSFLTETFLKTKISHNSNTIFLTPANDLLPHIVIRGIPDAEEQTDQPIRIDRIRPADIKFQNPQTSADVIGINNKVYVQKSQMGGGSPMIRGFAANSVLIVVDGVRMNNAIFRDGNLQNIIAIDAAMIEETEVLYGPGSVIYGSDAMGGVMAFQTKNPEIKKGQHYKGNVMLRTSTANRENSWHVDLGYGKNKVGGLSSISLSNYSNLKMGSNGPIEYTRPIFSEFNGINDSVILNEDPDIQYFTGYTQININQKFRYKPNEDHDLIVHLGYTTSSPITRYDRLLQMRNGQLRYGDWYYGPQKWSQFNVRYKCNMDTNGVADKMVITAAYQNFEESRHERNLFSKILDSRIEQVDAYTLNVDFDKKMGKLDLMYGAEGVYNMVNSEAFRTQIDTGSKKAISTRYPDGSSWYNLGIYSLLHTELNKKIKLSTGLRYSFVGLWADFNNSFFNFPFEKIELDQRALSGSLGGVFNLDKTHRFFVNVSSGFRAPNIDDVGKIFDAEPGKIVVPNSNLRPEYSYTGEIGYNCTLRDRITLAVNVYRTLVDDVIVRDNFTLDGKDSLMYNGELLQVQALVNNSFGFGNIYGAEFSLDARISSILKISSSYNFINGRSDDGSPEGVPLRHVTPNFGQTSVFVNYRRLRLQFYANYNQELAFEAMAPTEVSKAYLYTKDQNGNPYAPAWYTLNLKSGYHFTSALMLNIGLENILDKRYRPYGSGITAPGRNLILSLHGRF